MIKKNIYIKECMKHKKILFVIFILLLTETYVVFNIPFRMESMNNLLFDLDKNNYKTFILYFTGYIGFSVAQICVFFMLNITYKYLSNRITSGIVLKLYQRIYQAKIKWPSQFTVDEIMQTVNGDAYKLGDNGVKIVFQIIRLTINIVGLLFYMLVTNATLAIMIIFMFIIVMLIQTRLNKLLVGKSKKLKKTYGKYAYISNSFFCNHINYRYIKADNYFTRLIKNSIFQYLDDSFSIEKISSVNAVFGSLSNLFNVLIIMGIGAYLFVNGEITLGILITFSTFANVFGNYLASIPGLFMQVKEFRISYERVEKIMNIECHDQEAIEYLSDIDLQNIISKRENDINSIKLKRIAFSYNLKNNIIDNFSYIFEKNSIYCIVGENGAGKTTLINILLGEYPIAKGCIEINNHEIDLNRFMNAYRKHVTYCPSDCLLFDDTVRNNIKLDFDCPDEDIIAIMQKIQIDKDPELQLDKYVDTMHDNLSDGQKQKISIIRSLLNSREVIIFDEIEMHLDQETKKNVLNYLSQIKTNKIIILVSHDNYVVEKSDVIIHL